MLRLIDCIEAVAFDLDGTLIDTAPDLAMAANGMLVILGHEPLPEERIPAMIGGGIDELVSKVLQEVQAQALLDPKRLDAAAAAFRGLYAQGLFVRSRTYPGAIWTLRALEEAAIPACCVTNKESGFTLPLLEAAGMRERFVATLCADRLDDRKPNPHLLLAACEQLGIESAQLLYVGDSPTDVAAARGAGCRVVAVDYGYCNPVALAEMSPDGIVSHLPDIITLGIRGQTGARKLRAVS